MRSPRGLHEESLLTVDLSPAPDVKEPYVLTNHRAYGNYSFMTGGPVVAFSPKFPPPLNLSHEQIYLTRDISLADVMDGSV